MKVMIREKEAGFVMKNGVFERMISAGKYHFSKMLGYQVHIEEMCEELELTDIPYQVLIRDNHFQDSVIRFVIPEGHLGLIYRNGALYSCAKKSEYIFWNVFEKYEMRLISMEETEIGSEITKEMLSFIPIKYYTKVIVREGEAGLLYYDQVLQKTLSAGIYYFWNYHHVVQVRIVNIKQNELNISGQEILTKDKIGLRMNLTCNYHIKDVVSAVEKMSSLEQQLYSFVQLVIREITGNYKLDEILELKDQISKEIYSRLKQKEADFFVEISFAGIKDIILPGEIRDIMNSVLIAEKTAQANVISRREEVASTRSLLNTAKLMDENKTLYKLKELEYLERICEKVGEISINGNAGMIEQLGQLLGNR